MRLYSFFTPSHKIFVDEWFIPSLKDDYELILEAYPQVCPQAQFMTDGWLETICYKIDLIIRAIGENYNKVFVHSDVDIQFFQPTKPVILELIKNKDLIIQLESHRGTVCPGFMAIRGNERTLKLWKDIKSQVTTQSKKHDQDILNDLLVGHKLRLLRYLGIKNYSLYPNSYGIKWLYLPVEFFSRGAVSNKIWEPGQKIDVPENIILHHANWTLGVDNKIAMLIYVKNTVENRKRNKA